MVCQILYACIFIEKPSPSQKSERLCVYVGCINFACFYDFSIGFWNCSKNVVFLFFNLLTLLYFRARIIIICILDTKIFLLYCWLSEVKYVDELIFCCCLICILKKWGKYSIKYTNSKTRHMFKIQSKVSYGIF